MEISSGLSLDGKTFTIHNNTADEPMVVVHFLNFLPQNLKLGMGEAMFDYLVNFDWELAHKEW